MQGYLEQANVNPLTEISRLIEIQRLFDHISACMTTNDTSNRKRSEFLVGRRDCGRRRLDAGQLCGGSRTPFANSTRLPRTPYRWAARSRRSANQAIIASPVSTATSRWATGLRRTDDGKVPRREHLRRPLDASRKPSRIPYDRDTRRRGSVLRRARANISRRRHGEVGSSTRFRRTDRWSGALPRGPSAMTMDRAPPPGGGSVPQGVNTAVTEVRSIDMFTPVCIGQRIGNICGIWRRKVDSSSEWSRTPMLLTRSS